MRGVLTLLKKIEQSIFGMNLFVFNQRTNRIQISTDFWIYVATFVPLTLLTLGLWFVLSRKTKQKREHRQKSMPPVMHIRVH
jgi:hypothetical protein